MPFTLEKIISRLLVVLALISSVSIAFAGPLTPSTNPDPTGYSLDAIYNRLLTNVTSTEGSHNFNPASGPGATFHSLSEIYNLIPTIDPATVLEGTSYLGVTGTIPTRTLSVDSDLVSAGYYNSTTLSSVDTDLVAGNIALGTTIFGIDGTASLAIGTATTDQVIVGATFSNSSGTNLSGTMTNVGSETITPTTTNTTISAGYHDGTGYCAGDSNLVAINIKGGEDIFGITGTYQPNVPTCSSLGYTCSGSSGDICSCGNGGCVNVSNGSGVTNYTDVCSPIGLPGLTLQAKENGDIQVDLSINLNCLLGACNNSCQVSVCYLP